MDRRTLLNRYTDLIRITLPSLGRTRQWEIRESYAFERIVLDHLFADCWYNHLTRRLRAHEELNDTQLAQAVAIAEKMSKADRVAIALMEQQSRLWHDKPASKTVKMHPPKLAH